MQARSRDVLVLVHFLVGSVVRQTVLEGITKMLRSIAVGGEPTYTQVR